MNAQLWWPTVIVGIDFGMTCTGVAYSSEDSGWARPEVIQRWPNRKDALYRKYPSRVGYDRNGQAVDWGTCDISEDVVTQEGEFKLFLDPAFQDYSENGVSHSKAVRYYKDYMKALNKHIDATLMQRLPRWHERTVEYRFSTPTTWKNPRIIDQLKTWLAEAGFSNTPTKRVVFSRTEAEAAAVYVANMSPQQDHLSEGSTVMVVDAGGATTDLTVFEISEKSPEIIRMLELDKAEGMNIGSVMIDIAARKIVERRLRSMQVHADIKLKWLAEKMMEETVFRNFKCNYGNENVYSDHYMEIFGRPRQYVILGSTDMAQIFEPLVRDLIVNINDKVAALALLNPQRQLNYIILSGGLGSSPYIKQRLTAEFCSSQTRLANTRDLQILVATEPQLAVVKGLVMDRSQVLGQGTSVWTGRCCRNSYGILCKVRYDKNRHFGQPFVEDALTNTLWVEDQIDWIVKEGEVVPEEGILKPYTLKLTEERRFEPFRAHIVMCELPACDLPRSMKNGPVTWLCTVEGMFQQEDFMGSDIVKVKKSFFGKRKEHDLARFNLKIIVGSTDLEFEFVSSCGRRYGENSSKVKVTWCDA